MQDIIKDRAVMELFVLLSKTSSNNAKKDIIIANAENEHFLKFLDYLLNPFLITGISTKKITKETEKTSTSTKIFDSFSDLMQYILQNNTGNDEVIANIRHFLSTYEQDLRDFYSSIITKSAKIGCDIKSVNKALGREFIPQWEVQQGYNIEKYPLKEDEWFSLSQKLNGVRGTFFEGKIISRQGKEFIGLEHIIEDINRLFPVSDDWVLDGELVRNNTEGLADNENFRIGTGLLSQDDADKHSMQFIVFDILPKAEFVAAESALTYMLRLNELREIGEAVNHLNLESIRLVEILYTGCDLSMIDHFLDQMVSQDKEGLMLNRDKKYYRKRHNGILKVKRFYTVDLQVTATEEGSGRLLGKLGAFVVAYKGTAVNVGSGMTDEQRDEFWQARDSLVGRVIEVKYKEESMDKKTGHYSLQFPIFIALREEGKEVSMY
ncbi:MAG: hypothetical protein FWC66_02720 [Oscillospiraceae bacterium]|nr:hypothetical protein [Oscillospiraceae bacterium]